MHTVSNNSEEYKMVIVCREILKKNIENEVVYKEECL